MKIPNKTIKRWLSAEPQAQPGEPETPLRQVVAELRNLRDENKMLRELLARRTEQRDAEIATSDELRAALSDQDSLGQDKDLESYREHLQVRLEADVDRQLGWHV